MDAFGTSERAIFIQRSEVRGSLTFCHPRALQALPLTYFPILAAILLGYMILIQAMKGFYIRRYGWQ